MVKYFSAVGQPSTIEVGQWAMFGERVLQPHHREESGPLPMRAQ